MHKKLTELKNAGLNIDTLLKQPALFMSIAQIGPKTALEIYNKQGIKTSLKALERIYNKINNKTKLKGKKLIEQAKKNKKTTTQTQTQPFPHPLPKGWLIKYMLPLDLYTNKRWYFWSETWINNKIILPIPRITFSASVHPETMKMLLKCIDSYHATALGSRNVEMFIDWILWGLNYQDVKFPDINKELSNHWYRTFNLELLLRHPHDYPARLLEHIGSKGGPGWFATPMNVTTMMAEITTSDMKPWETSNDCCLGTGSMLLPISNKSLKISGQDVSGLMVKSAALNFMLYVPWVIRPFPEYMINNLKNESEALLENPEFQKTLTNIRQKYNINEWDLIGYIQRINAKTMNADPKIQTLYTELNKDKNVQNMLKNMKKDIKKEQLEQNETKIKEMV